jgi:putative DNA primase/helicase
MALIINPTKVLMTNDTTSTINNQSQTIKEISKKTAFKIIFGRGVKLTTSVKKALNDTIGCHFDSFHRAYVCPIETRNSVTDFLNESKIEASFVDVLDINKGKDRKIIGLENRIEILQKKTHEEDMRLLSEIAQYDSKRSVYDFEEPPIFENLPEEESEERKKIRFSIEMDLHKRYVKNKEDRKELENLRNSCTLHEKEETADEKLLDCLQKNEIGDAELFVDLFNDKYIFDPSEGKGGSFYIWNGQYWELDTYKERYKDFDVIADAYLTASKDNKIEEKTKQALFTRAQQLRTNNRRRNVLETITAHISFKGVWDYVPKLLPCSNGIIDLITGDFSPSREDQFIRKVCPIKYNKSAKCPKFIQFLDDISLGNIEWIKFLQRSIGYALLGVPVEEVLIYWYGEGGRNGKGTLTKILQHVFGPLARTFPAEMLLLQRNLPSSSGPSPELANLEGVRIAIFSEINEGRKIDSAKVKNLSGRDKISCRRLFSNHDLQIEPTHTMFLQTNYKPKAPSDDNALW